MMLDRDALERQLFDQFLETLKRLPKVRATLSSLLAFDDPNRGVDACVELWVGEQSTTLQIEVKKDIYPRDVRQAVRQYQELVRRWPQSSEGRRGVPFLLAQSISPGAKDLLKDERVGYFDSGGSLFLPADSIYVYIEKPPPKALSKSIRSLFLGRRAQVLHALLMRHGEWIGVKETAGQAQVSPATASQVLSELEKFDWVVARGQGPTKERNLREPGGLLDAWAKQLAVLRPPSLRQFFVPSVHSEELVRKFAALCTAHKAEYAITHEAASQRYAPFPAAVSQVRCRLMVGAAADGVLGAIDARGVDHGANLAVIDVQSSGELLFRDQIDGALLASPVQVYLDLARSEGRAQEMAKHLRQARIGF